MKSNRINLRMTVAVAVLILFGRALHAQIVVSGPTCVMAGTPYLYTFQGDINQQSLQSCVTGGILIDSSSSCIDGKYGTTAKIVWNTSANTGSLNVSNTSASGLVRVNITRGLSPGLIDSSRKFQHLDTVAIPKALQCAAATGGHCAPVYTYQWQISTDALKWKDITGGATQNLILTRALKQTTYYRRKVTEKKSGGIAYTIIATLEVYPYKY